MLKNIEKSIAFHQSGGIEVGENVVIDGPITREQNHISLLMRTQIMLENHKLANLLETLVQKLL